MAYSVQSPLLTGGADPQFSPVRFSLSESARGDRGGLVFGGLDLQPGDTSCVSRGSTNRMTYASGDPFFIGVCGGTASGKTTVCELLQENLAGEEVAFIPSDAFYKDLDEADRELAYKNEYDFDHPDAIDFGDLKAILRDLHHWKDVEIPNYDFSCHARKQETTFVRRRQVIITEGILIFTDDELRDMFDLKVFVDCDADIRLARRVSRDISDRGRSLNGVLEQYHKFVKPSYETFVEPSKRFADVIIPNIGASVNKVACDVIAQHIRLQLAARRPVSARMQVINPGIPKTVVRRISEEERERDTPVEKKSPEVQLRLPDKIKEKGHPSVEGPGGEVEPYPNHGRHNGGEEDATHPQTEHKHREHRHVHHQKH